MPCWSLIDPLHDAKMTYSLLTDPSQEHMMTYLPLSNPWQDSMMTYWHISDHPRTAWWHVSPSVTPRRTIWLLPTPRDPSQDPNMTYWSLSDPSKDHRMTYSYSVNHLMTRSISVNGLGLVTCPIVTHSRTPIRHAGSSVTIPWRYVGMLPSQRPIRGP